MTPLLCSLSDFTCSRITFRVPPVLLLVLGGGVGDSSAGTICGIFEVRQKELKTPSSDLWHVRMFSWQNQFPTRVQFPGSSIGHSNHLQHPAGLSRGAESGKAEAAPGRGLKTHTHTHTQMELEGCWEQRQGHKAERDQDSEAQGHRNSVEGCRWRQVEISLPHCHLHIPSGPPWALQAAGLPRSSVAGPAGEKGKRSFLFQATSDNKYLDLWSLQRISGHLTSGL